MAGPPTDNVELPMVTAEELLIVKVWPRAVMTCGNNAAAACGCSAGVVP